MTATTNATDATTTSTMIPTMPAPVTVTMPAPPAGIDLDGFNLSELSNTIKTASANLTSEKTLAEYLKRLRRALLTDRSFDGIDQNAHVRHPTGGKLTTAREALSVWEQGLIYVDTGYNPDRGSDAYERLCFNPDPAGDTFNLRHSSTYVLGAAVLEAINQAITQGGWKGETEQVIANRLRAARERLEILRESLPSSETIASVESYIAAACEALTSRVEVVIDQFSVWINSPIDLAAPAGLEFLSALDDIKVESSKIKGICRRWMLAPQGGIDAKLAAIESQLETRSKQLLALADEIDNARRRVGR